MSPLLRHQIPEPPSEGSSDDGFTLIELLVAVSLTAVIGAAMLGGVVQSLNISQVATARADAVTELQVAIERITRDVRGANPVLTATADSVQVIVFDEVTRRDITWSRTGTVLTRTTITYPDHTSTSGATSTSTVADDLQAATVFAYAYGPGGVSPANVTRVDITLTKALPDNGDTVQLGSSATVRNEVGA